MIPATMRRSILATARSSLCFRPGRPANARTPALCQTILAVQTHTQVSARAHTFPVPCFHNTSGILMSHKRGLSSESSFGSDSNLSNSVDQPAVDLGEFMQKFDVLKIRQELEAMTNQKISVREFASVCAKYGVSEAEAKNLLLAFHQSSVVLNFASSSSVQLRDTVFLKPKDVLDTVWATFDLSGSVSLAELEHKQAELIVLKSEFRALDTAKRMLDQTAEQQANRAVWVGSVLPVGTFLALCRMTYWEFSWDIVEPISFFVSTMGPICFFYVWFASKKEDFSMAGWRDSMIEKSKETLYRAKAFDLARYEAVAEAIRLCEEDIRLLKQG